MTSSALKAERRKIRDQLKRFDADFYAKHNRLPEKDDKEPIRHLYEKYNSVRAQIELSRLDKSTADSFRKLLQPSNIMDESNSSNNSPNSAELERLLAEKKELYRILRSNQKIFLKENNRPMSTYDDIKPDAYNYRRYKEIKKAIALLQGNE